MSEKTVSLILAFLHNKENKIFGNIMTSRFEGHIPHIIIRFNYTGTDVKICVYNDHFIKVVVDDMPWSIVDGIKPLRDSIYKLEHYNYGRYA